MAVSGPTRYCNLSGNVHGSELLSVLGTCTWGVRGHGAHSQWLSQRGVCCSIFVTKGGVGWRSPPDHTCIGFKKPVCFTMQPAGVLPESSRRRGQSEWQRRETTSLFFCHKTRVDRFQGTVRLSWNPKVLSCISIGTFLHREECCGHLSPVVKTFFLTFETIQLWPLPLDSK